MNPEYNFQEIPIAEDKTEDFTPQPNTPAIPPSDSNIVPGPGGSFLKGGSFSTPAMEVTPSSVTLRDYDVSTSGMSSFGDGNDLASTFADQGTAPTGTTKTDDTAGATIYRLDRDVYYTTMTVNATVTVNTNGYRIFCSVSLTNNGTISRAGVVGGNGGNGGNGSAVDVGGTAGAAGTAPTGLAAGYTLGTFDGRAGGAGGIGQDTEGSGVKGVDGQGL